IAFVAACSRRGPTMPTNSDAGSSAYDGVWQGLTPEGLNVTFTLLNNQVRSFDVDLIETPGDSCVFAPGGGDIGASQNFDLNSRGGYPSVAANRFTIVSRAPLYARLQSATTQLGSVDFTLTATLAGTSGAGVGDFFFSVSYGGSTCSAHRSIAWT